MALNAFGSRSRNQALATRVYPADGGWRITNDGEGEGEGGAIAHVGRGRAAIGGRDITVFRCLSLMQGVDTGSDARPPLKYAMGVSSPRVLLGRRGPRSQNSSDAELASELTPA